MDLNRVLFVGNLPRDPESRPAGNTTVCAFSIGVNYGYGDKKSTAWIDVSCFGKSAEFAQKYFKKGQSVFVEGAIKQDNWEDKQTGAKRSKLSVVADRVSFADSPKGERSDHKPDHPAAPTNGKAEDDSLPF